MGALRVSIIYQPRLYSDLFRRLFKCIETIEVVEGDVFANSETSESSSSNGSHVDVIILSMNHEGQPEMDLLPHPLPQAKIIAFSPAGDFGLRRLPGESSWETIRPFGLIQLFGELTGGQEQTPV